MTLSKAARFAWGVGEIEARRAGNAKIEPEQIFIGVCKVGNLLEVEDWGDVSEAGKEEYLDEAAVIVQVFSGVGIDRIQVYRQLRRVGPKGSTKHADGAPISRTDIVKQAFTEAVRLANDEPASALHVGAALLVTCNSLVGHLTGIGVDVAALRTSFRAAAGLAAPAQPMLGEFARDLTALASQGLLPPMTGRRNELLKMVRTLGRQTKNNVLLVGEPGVGKTALVEGLAQRITAGKSLRGHRLLELRLNDLLAGAAYRGQFEERLKQVVDEAQSDPRMILFVDEIHTVLRAGAVEGGALDAANILKPALARGGLRMIGSTTATEYTKYLSRDPAFQRRFQVIEIAEPSPEESEAMLRALIPTLESQHGVQIAREAARAAVELTVRYIKDRFLPDKAIDALDEACARISVPELSADEISRPRGPMNVTADVVAAVVAEWTGVPILVGDDEALALLGLADKLKTSVIGQDVACEVVADAIQRSRAGFKDPGRPVGVFLLIGPTGVGKTELAKATAANLFGSPAAMIRIDMSEYMDRFQASRLIGSPPGYVGHDEEGQLTGALRRRPNSVVLLDEIEKAHPGVLTLFLQVFDEGRLTDGKGRITDATHAIFFLTSNLNVQSIAHREIGFVRGAEAQAPRQMNFQVDLPSEFLNRLDAIVEFKPLGLPDLYRIAENLLREAARRLDASGITLEWSSEGVAALVSEAFEPDLGARPLKRAIERRVLTPISKLRLEGKRRLTRFRLRVSDGHILLDSLDALRPEP